MKVEEESMGRLMHRLVCRVEEYPEEADRKRLYMAARGIIDRKLGEMVW